MRLAAMLTTLLLATATFAQTPARGTFDVTVKPLSADFGRMSIDKTWRGDLEGTSKGEMLSFRSGDSGAYVALETVTATLAGRSGTFVLQHQGTMSGGKQQFAISIVPGSGTGALAGISGTLKIVIAEGKHSYELDYALPK
jgi:hypothetical protein